MPSHANARTDSSSSAGVIAGVVVGVVCLLALKAGLVFFFCRRRKRRALLLAKPSPTPEQSRRRSAEEILQQLKEQEFDCHHIEICIDANRKEIELGSGGFGRVIKGMRDGVQPVAIKMMFRTDQKAQDDFLKEIKLLKQLSRDANIVQYFGASLQEDQLWLVTEYMEGGDLRKALSADDEHRLTWWNGGKQIALDTARGLAFLHSQHVIHRDIKSHNILLTRERRAKIADVGMAQIMSEDHYASLNSQQGTFAWASPELILREGRCTEKVDIYSFGVCLWEIVTSQMPKRSEMYHPTPDECPPEVGRLIEDCMRRNPRDRPSAREIYRRLRVCEPLSESEEGGQVILDSAEAGGRNSRMIAKAQRGAFYPLEPAPETAPISQPFAYDSPMCTFDGIKYTKSGCSKHDSDAGPESPLPTSNTAFHQLVAKYSQASTSTPVLTTSPESILASSSIDADLSHIPSVQDTARDPAALPDFVLTINDSRYLDFTQTLSSEDIYASGGALTALSLLSPNIYRSNSSQELQMDHLTTCLDEPAPSESENGTLAVAVASIQGYDGSSVNSRLNTGSHHSDADSTVCTEEKLDREPESDLEAPLALSTSSNQEDKVQGNCPGSPPTVEALSILSRPTQAQCSLHTGTSSLHTGSTTVYEDIDEHPAWLRV